MAQQQLKYIIVDDSYYTSLSIRDAISELRPKFILKGIAEVTSEARSILLSQKIDLIVTKDYVSGHFVVDDLKDILTDIPIIVVSQYHRNKARLSDLNMVDFLLEPVTPADLSRALNRL